jgi:hypothetical protein
LNENKALKNQVSSLSRALRLVSAETGSNKIELEAAKDFAGDMGRSDDTPKLKSALKKSARAMDDFRPRSTPPALKLPSRRDSRREEMAVKRNSIKDSSSSDRRDRVKPEWATPKYITSKASAAGSRGRSANFDSKDNSFATKDKELDFSKNLDFGYPKNKVLREQRQAVQIATPKKNNTSILRSKKSLKEVEPRNLTHSKPVSTAKDTSKEKRILGLMAAIGSKRAKDEKPKKLNLSRVSKDSSFKDSKTPMSAKSKKDKSVPRKGTAKMVIPDSSKVKTKQS